MAIRIILADDHKIVLEGLHTLIEKQQDMKIVGEAENGQVAVKLVSKHSPDVIIMDISMPDLNGIDAIRKITAESRNTKVVVLSIHDDKRYVMEAFKAGALGYLLKSSSSRELIYAIQTVISNKIYIDPSIANIMLEGVVCALSNNVSLNSFMLTNRECEVLKLIAEGKTTKEIALILYVSKSTIEAHRKKIMDKLDIYSVAGLTKFAIREGLTTIEK